jgi:thiosulfate reductase cytochrome b subunit
MDGDGVLATTQATRKDRPMELISTAQGEDLDHSVMEALRVRAWRAEQLRRLGLPHMLADTFADLVDWHTLAGLVERGCPPELALEIVR